MAFDLHIKNIGKLTDAKLRIGRFTVLAGPNNTGKSFVSKILYSLFNAMNANHAEAALHTITGHIRWERDRLRSALSEKASMDSLYADLENTIHKMEALAAEQSFDDPAEIDRFLAKVSNMAKKFPELFREIRSSAAKQQPRPAGSLLKDFENTLDRLQEVFGDMTAEKFMRSGIDLMIKENLIQNFQVAQSTQLRGTEEGESKFSIPDTVEFKFGGSDRTFAIQHFDFQKLKQYSKVIYLESPIHWKLKNALEYLHLSDRHQHTRRDRLLGVPGYFYDLASELRSEYTEDMDFPGLAEKLTSKNVLGGKLVISPDTGEIWFREKDRSSPLVLTATGVVNLGILALLIERKILKKDSFIFFDEPEAHLHTEWQVVMAEVLFELAKGGAHVVIATHSDEILKWLEVHIKYHPDDVGLVALNKFPPDTVTYGEESFEDKMAEIKQALTKPFADLYMKGLGG